MTHTTKFSVRAGDRVPFVLTWFPSSDPPPEAVDAERALLDTETYWREWIVGYGVAGERLTHSKVLAWVAFDRAVEAVERWDLPGPVERWRRQLRVQPLAPQGPDAPAGDGRAVKRGWAVDQR